MKHILLVDDNVANLKYAENVLTSLYRVTCLTSGLQAVKFLQKHRPDLVLMDINMPGMDGFDTVKAMKDNPATAHIPVIFLTSQSDPETEEAALNLGVLDFIAKPMVPRTALSRIKMHLELLDYRIDLEAMVEEKTAKLNQLQGMFSESVSELVEQRDGNTGSHIRRLRSYVNVLTDELMKRNLPGYLIDHAFKEDLYQATPMHDIGKIRVRDNVLLKPGKLTEEEMAHMRMHTVWGGEVIDHVISGVYYDAFLDTAKHVTRHHHEKYNGSGYPDGLEGENIPLAARIMSIADVYDALVTERPYKKPFPHEVAVDIIVKDQGIAFDPVLVDIFMSVNQQFNHIAQMFES